MKRIVLILLALIAAAAFVSCGGSDDGGKADEPTAQPSTQLHTVPPSDESPQIEWAPVDCEISLDTSDYVYAVSENFLTFALVGTTDEDCELRFALDDESAEQLSKQSPDNEYFIIMNDKTLRGDVTLSDDASVITLKGGYTYAELCALASEIRGIK